MRAARLVVDLGNKKGPQRALMHTACKWMASAIPGGAPWYDENKKFGNFITHGWLEVTEDCAGYNAH
jgi:hypothetical protein